MGVTRKILLGGAWIFLLYGSLLRLSIAAHRTYQVDEVEHIHAAYNMHEGKVIYRDFWEGHTPLIYFVLQPLIRVNNPEFSFLASRILMYGLSLAIIFLVYRIAAKIFGKSTGIIAALLLTFVTTFAERGIEVRPDVWLTTLFLLSFWFEIQGDDIKNSILSSLCMSMAFLFTQKAIVFCLIIGSSWLLKTFRKKSASGLVLPVLVFLVPILVSFLYFWHLGAAQQYFTRCFWTIARATSRQLPIKQAGFDPLYFLMWESRHNIVFSMSALIGLLLLLAKNFEDRLSLKRLISDSDSQQQFMVPFCSVIGLIYLWINPFPYPYAFVPVLPFLAMTAAWLLRTASKKIFYAGGKWNLVSAAVLAILILSTALPRMLIKGQGTKAYQMFMLRETQKITSKDDSVMDLMGLYFRPDGYWVFSMTGAQLDLYQVGFFPPMIPQLRANQTVVIMSTYRTQLLPSEEKDFFRDHYVHYRGNIFVQGCYLMNLSKGAEKTFEVIKKKTFRYIGPPESLEVDGRVFTRDILDRGYHHLRALAPIQAGELIMDPPGFSIPDKPRQDFYINFD